MINLDDWIVKGGIGCCGGNCSGCPYFPKGLKGAMSLFDVPKKIECIKSCTVEEMQRGFCICKLEEEENDKEN